MVVTFVPSHVEAPALFSGINLKPSRRPRPERKVPYRMRQPHETFCPAIPSHAPQEVAGRRPISAADIVAVAGGERPFRGMRGDAGGKENALTLLAADDGGSLLAIFL